MRQLVINFYYKVGWHSLQKLHKTWIVWIENLNILVLIFLHNLEDGKHYLNTLNCQLMEI